MGRTWDRRRGEHGLGWVAVVALLGMLANSCQDTLLLVSVSRTSEIDPGAKVAVTLNGREQARAFENIPESPRWSRTFGYSLDRGYPKITVTLVLSNATVQPGLPYTCTFTWTGQRITWTAGTPCPTTIDGGADGPDAAPGGSGGRSGNGGGGGTIRTGGAAGSMNTGSGGDTLATGGGGGNGAAGRSATGGGGAVGSGGAVGAGGSMVGTGGSNGTGGRPGTGGAMGGATGGATGGMSASGGATGAGGGTGSGGATTTGGTIGSGGAVSSGGVTASGGAPGSGGTTASGGTTGTGGTMATGGAPGTGGSPGSGGIGACLNTPTCSCADYCAALSTRCGQIAYFPESDCEATCASLPWGLSSADSPINTTGCRVRKLVGPQVQACSSGGPIGGGMCGGSPCNLYCDAFVTNCSATTSWTREACLSACDGFPWGWWDDDKLYRDGPRGGCLLYWAGQAGRPSPATAACPNAAPNSPVCQ